MTNKVLRNNQKEICTRILWDTKHYYVVPSVGSFVKGYLLIISKEHQYNMGTYDKLDELNELIMTCKKTILTLYNSKSIVFEHGSTQNSETSGASICHAHMHVVPTAYDLEREIQKTANLIPLESIFDLTDYSANSYVFYQNTYSENYMVDIQNPPSQYLRQILAKKLGLSEFWNWRRYPFYDNIVKCINDYRDNYTEKSDKICL